MKVIKKLISRCTLLNNQGFAMIAALMALLMLTAVGTLVFTLSTQDIRVSMRVVSEKKAFNTAQSGGMHKFKADLSSPILFPDNPHVSLGREKPGVAPLPIGYAGGDILGFDRKLNTFDCDILDNTDIDDPASRHNNCKVAKNLELVKESSLDCPPRTGQGIGDDTPRVIREMRAIGKDGSRSSVEIQYAVCLQ